MFSRCWAETNRKFPVNIPKKISAVYYLLLGKQQNIGMIFSYFWGNVAQLLQPTLQTCQLKCHYIYFVFCKLLSHMKTAEEDSGPLSLGGSAKLPLNSVHQLFFWSIVQDDWHGERGAVAAAKSPGEAGEACQQHGSKTEKYEWGSKWCYFHTRCTSLNPSTNQPTIKWFISSTCKAHSYWNVFFLVVLLVFTLSSNKDAATTDLFVCPARRRLTNLICPENNGLVFRSLQSEFDLGPLLGFLLLHWARKSIIYHSCLLTIVFLVWEQLPTELLLSESPGRRTETREERRDVMFGFWFLSQKLYNSPG